MTEELEQRFGTQIMCTQDILENHTLVVFVHEFGNLRLELESSLTCNVQLEHSYLVDFSKQLIAWVKGEGYSLLDINLFPMPFASLSTRSKMSDAVGKEIMIYLWDNYIQLSGAQQIILIGHGPGCQPLMDLLAGRSFSAMKRVKAVIQVLAHVKIPLVPRHIDDLRSWYLKHSFVIVPSNHQIFNPENNKEAKRHGKLLPIDESQPIKLIMRALPILQAYVKKELKGVPFEKH